MARVTVEDCLERVKNRFALTVLAARRARALSEGRGTPLIVCDNKEEVTALREISANTVRWVEDVEGVMRQFIEEQRSQLRSTTGEHTFLEAASLTGGDGDEDEDDEDVVEELPSDLEKLGTGKGEDEDEDDDEGGPEDVVDEDGEVAADDSLPTDEDFDDVADDDDSDDDDDEDDEG